VEALDALRRLVKRHGVDLREHEVEVRQALTTLGKRGAAAYGEFLDSSAQREIGDLEVQAGEQGLRIDVTDMATAPRAYLWELLYAGDPPGPLAVLDPEQFWGFRYRLGRVYQGIQLRIKLPLGQGVFSAIHEGLLHSREEEVHLKEHLLAACRRLGVPGATVENLETYLPAAGTPEELLGHFVLLMADPQFAFGIVHFACHCENPDQQEAVDQAYLRFTSHGSPLELSIEFLSSLRGKEKYALKHRPFFFVNACESSTPGHIMQKLDFPNSLLHWGAGGVIATYAIMPDTFASAFAAEFYRRLFAKPSTNDHVYVGEALLETRRYFWETYKNPLGLAYGFYARSDQLLQLTD
jgi:hypothetical protein